MVVGQDGAYSFDVTAQFKAFGGASIKVVVECKKHAHPIKRELVQVLNDKKRSVGAHKAILVATAPFQSGAIEYASTNGVALVQIVAGSAMYIKASAVREHGRRPASNKVTAPKQHSQEHTQDPLVGLFYGQNLKRDLIFPQMLSSRMSYEMERFLHGS